MRKCARECMIEGEECVQKDCRLWLDYSEDLNCTLVAVNKNGPMTLRQVADRLGISFVRVKQIETEILSKLKKRAAAAELKG